MGFRKGFGEAVEDGILGTLGSWPFFWAQSILFAIWMYGNARGWFHFDPPPWLRMNIIMSIEAAYATTFVLMADRRQSSRYRKQLRHMQTLIESQAENGKAMMLILHEYRDLLKVLLTHTKGIDQELDRISDVLNDDEKV